jgi:hypothetical protein
MSRGRAIRVLSPLGMLDGRPDGDVPLDRVAPTTGIDRILDSAAVVCETSEKWRRRVRIGATSALVSRFAGRRRLVCD